MVGVPGRVVEEKSDKPSRFAPYAVVLEHDDPYAKAIQSLMAHSEELERALAAVNEKLARLERETQQRDPLRAVK